MGLLGTSIGGEMRIPRSLFLVWVGAVGSGELGLVHSVYVEAWNRTGEIEIFALTSRARWVDCDCRIPPGARIPRLPDHQHHIQYIQEDHGNTRAVRVISLECGSPSNQWFGHSSLPISEGSIFKSASGT